MASRIHFLFIPLAVLVINLEAWVGYPMVNAFKITVPASVMALVIYGCFVFNCGRSKKAVQ